MKLIPHLRQLLCLLCALTLVWTVMPAPVLAEAGPALSLSSVSGYDGNTVTLTLRGTALPALATLHCELYYNSQVFDFVSGSATGGMTFSANSTNDGQIILDGIAAEGVSGDSALYQFTLRIASGTAVGDYPVQMALGDASDVALAPVELTRNNGVITVFNHPSSTPTVYLSASRSQSTLYQGDTVTVTFWLHSNYNLCSGKFQVDFDSALLEYVDYAFVNSVIVDGSDLTQWPGRLSVSFLSLTPVTYGNLFQVSFRVIADCDTTTAISCEGSQLYNSADQQLQGSSCSTNLSLKVAPSETPLPRAWLIQEDDGTALQCALWVEGADIAAGDFVITYDSSLLTYGGDAAKTAPESLVMMINDTEPGRLSLSMAGDPLTEDTQIIRFSLIPGVDGAKTTLTLSGSGVANAALEAMELQYGSITVDVPPVVTPGDTAGTFTVNRMPGGITDVRTDGGSGYAQVALTIPAALAPRYETGFSLLTDMGSVVFDPAAAAQLALAGVDLTFVLSPDGTVALTDESGAAADFSAGNAQLTIPAPCDPTADITVTLLLVDGYPVAISTDDTLTYTADSFSGCTLSTVEGTLTDESCTLSAGNLSPEVYFCAAAYEPDGRMRSVLWFSSGEQQLDLTGSPSAFLFLLDGSAIPLWDPIPLR